MKKDEAFFHDLVLTEKFKKIREDFPALKQKIHGKNLAYLDNAATAQKPLCVIETLKQAAIFDYANIHRGVHYLASNATEFYENSRETVQNFIHASSSAEIIFTKNATEAINCVAYGWAAKHLNTGDEIIVSIMEHHSNLIPWYFLREHKGIKISFVEVNQEGCFSMEAFTKFFTKKTKLVAITHMSNVLGTILPIKDIIDYSHREGAKILIDGSQGILHEKVDVQALNCDWYVFTGHKIYGPTGIGVLFGKLDVLEEMQPFQGGGEMVERVTRDTVVYASAPYRFEAGTPPIIEAIALGASLDYITKIGQNDIINYEKGLCFYIKMRLKALKDVHILGNASDKGGIFSFYCNNIHAHDLASFLDQKGVAVRSGMHCAMPLLEFYGMGSICRASIAMYSSKEDIDQWIDALEQAIVFFKSAM